MPKYTFTPLLVALVISAGLSLTGCGQSSSPKVTADSPNSLPSTLTLATWNAEHLAYPSEEGCRPRDTDEMAAMAKYASSLNADIVVMQEVASEQAVAQLFPPKDWQIVVSSRKDSPAYECGNVPNRSTQQKVAIAVKHGIQINDIEQFSQLGLDNPGLRYGVKIQVTTAAGPLDILGVHLKSGCFVDDYRTSDKAACHTLSAQVPELEHWLDQHSQTGVPFIILGDFNHRLTTPGNYLAQKLQAIGGSDQLNLSIATQGVVGCHPRYPAPIDHIIVGGHKQAPQIDTPVMHYYTEPGEEGMLSDHCAVTAHVTLK